MRYRYGEMNVKKGLVRCHTTMASHHTIIPNPRIPWARTRAFVSAKSLDAATASLDLSAAFRYARLTTQTPGHETGIKRTTIERRVE